MKIKFYEGTILLAIVLIELFGFNNEFKYDLFNWVSPAFNSFFVLHINAFKLCIIAFLLISILLIYFILSRKKKEPLFIVYLIKGFQVKGSDWIGIFNIMFTLISIAWIGNELYAQTLNGVYNALIFICFMLLYPLICAILFLPQNRIKDVVKPKVLISALSLLTENDLRTCMNEMDKPELKHKWKEPIFKLTNGELKKHKDFIFGPWFKYDPIRKSIIKHGGSFKEIHLIVSSEVANSIKSLPDDLKPEALINNFLHKHFPNSKTEVFLVQHGISGNDMGMTGIGLESVLKIALRKFKDKEILFNITGGTAAISSAMILKAIPRGRKAEYARQDTGIIEEIPLSIYDLKDLWDELLEKVA
ncbi:MAG: hypothetical protein WCO02_13755 [Bacteroidota bacterium]